jgi:hypothetical protein
MLREFGAEPQPNKRIVKSGKIVRAAGVSAGIDLGLFIVGEVCGQERAEVVQLLIEYDLQPPFKSCHPSKASKAVLEKSRYEMLKRAKNPRHAISAPLIMWRNVLERVRAKASGPSVSADISLHGRGESWKDASF